MSNQATGSTPKFPELDAIAAVSIAVTCSKAEPLRRWVSTANNSAVVKPENWFNALFRVAWRLINIASWPSPNASLVNALAN